jgi:hypothetical protein
MFKTTCIVLAAVLATASAAATFEMRKRIICDTPEEIFTRLNKEYGEQPEWTGHSDIQNTDVVLTVNSELGTWTLVEFNKDMACVLAVGDKSSITRGKDAVFKLKYL